MLPDYRRRSHQCLRTFSPDTTLRTRVLLLSLVLLLSGVRNASSAATPQNDQRFYLVVLTCTPNGLENRSLEWVSGVIRTEKPVVSSDVQSQALSAWRAQNRDIAQGSCALPQANTFTFRSRAEASERRNQVLASVASRPWVEQREFHFEYVEN
jgi:hypothetical protein